MGGVGPCKRQSVPGVRPAVAYAGPAGPAVPLVNNNGKLLSFTISILDRYGIHFPLQTKIQAGWVYLLLLLLLPGD